MIHKVVGTVQHDVNIMSPAIPPSHFTGRWRLTHNAVVAKLSASGRITHRTIAVPFMLTVTLAILTVLTHTMNRITIPPLQNELALDGNVARLYSFRSLPIQVMCMLTVTNSSSQVERRMTTGNRQELGTVIQWEY